MPKDYDHRRPNPRRNDNDDNGNVVVDRTTKRERSRSPVDERARREAVRRSEMERLRAENEEEERRLAVALDKRIIDNDVQETDLKPQEEIIAVDEAELEGLDEEEQMRKLLGIEGFGSTKGQKVESNHDGLASGATNKSKKRKYRQCKSCKLDQFMILSESSLTCVGISFLLLLQT